MDDSTSECTPPKADYIIPPNTDGFIGRGHNAGDFLEAYDWGVLESSPGFLKLDVHLPKHLLNPSQQLFGGFTGTYVDLVALQTMRAGQNISPQKRGWMSTVNMRIDYFEPVLGPRFFIESEIINRRERTVLIGTRFLDASDKTLVYAITTLKILQQPEESVSNEE